MRLRTPWPGTRSPSSGSRATRLGGVVVAGALAVTLVGCGENYPELVKREHVRVAQYVRNLGAALDGGRIRNANIIRQYATLVARDRPEVAKLTDELAREGSTAGLAYNSLTTRLAKVNLAPSDERQADTSIDGITRVEAAADPTVFNDSLIDVVNVLADLSNGKLPRLHVPESAPRSLQGAGSHLVGNPRYGQWRGGGGNSFWVFYGQYAMMRSLFFGPRMYYGSWYRNRGWSYYGDVGRNYYGGRADSARWNRAAKTYPRAAPRKSYGNLRSQRRLSTYGRAGTRTAARVASGGTRRGSSYASSARGSRRSSSFRGK